MIEPKHILVVTRMIQSCRKAIQYGVSLAHEEGYLEHIIFDRSKDDLV